MKRKLTVFLATIVVALGLLLGASTAQATEVILDDLGNVIRIENLDVTDENTKETTVYNVYFLYDTAVNVYAQGFDFPDDETIILYPRAGSGEHCSQPKRPHSAARRAAERYTILYRK